MTQKIKLPSIWKTEQYIRPIRTELSGQMAQTHLALLRASNGTPVRGYVKHYGAQHPRGLFNEWFGYTVQSAMGVPQPECALLPAPIPGTQVSAWAFASLEPLPTFQGTPKQLYRLDNPAQCSELTKRLMSCTAFPLLVAADQLLANSDRNMGNLVFTGKHQFVAIDQGGILGGLDWKLADLWFTQKWALSKPIELLVPTSSLSSGQKNAIYAATELVEQAFFELQHELKEAMGTDNAEVHVAMQAVWWRALAIAEWFRHKLNLL